MSNASQKRAQQNYRKRLNARGIAVGALAARTAEEQDGRTPTIADRSHHGKWARATATWPLTSSRAVVGGGTKRFRGWPERPVQLRERLAGPQ